MLQVRSISSNAGTISHLWFIVDVHLLSDVQEVSVLVVPANPPLDTTSCSPRDATWLRLFVSIPVVIAPQLHLT